MTCLLLQSGAIRVGARLVAHLSVPRRELVRQHLAQRVVQHAHRRLGAHVLLVACPPQPETTTKSPSEPRIPRGERDFTPIAAGFAPRTERFHLRPRARELETTSPPTRRASPDA
eukprot:7875587-Pyramimonas_sp.AAC.1